MSNDLTTTTNNLPALPQTQALDIDAGDVALPRVKVGQPQSPAVMDELVKKGSLFSTTGSDDEYPEQLYANGDEDGLLVHVLGLRKGLSLNKDGELHTWAFGDPDAPSDARVTYDYHLYLPEVDDNQVPYKFLFTSTATAAAKQINTVLKRNEARGPSYTVAFRITTKKREAEKGGQKFQWFVPVVRVVDADDSHVAEAGQLAGMIHSAPSSPALEASTGNEPAI